MYWPLDSFDERDALAFVARREASVANLQG